MSKFPTFYDPSRIGTLYYPDVATIAAEATTADLKSAVEDKENVHLVIIDILATCMALRIGDDTLQPILQEMKGNLRSKRYA